jgi:hypothetical protein
VIRGRPDQLPDHVLAIGDQQPKLSTAVLAQLEAALPRELM